MPANNFSSALERINNCQRVSLMLADLGASGENWEPYDKLKRYADVIRFDPDARELVTLSGVNGHQVHTVNKAVVESDNSTVDFYLTKSPFCSSTLKPDLEKIKNYPYAKDFDVERTATVPAISITKTLQELSLKEINWIKIDTQGTEFRILKSIPQNIFSRIMVCDIESSLYQHYHHADTLPEIHDFMIAQGFWIVEMRPHMNGRISSKSLEVFQSRFTGRDRKVYDFTRHKSVTTLEFCYARTIESAIKENFSQDEFVNLFICHFCLGAYEYCFEIIEAIEVKFGKIPVIPVLKEELFAAVDSRVLRSKFPYFIEGILFRIKRWFPNYVWK